MTWHAPEGEITLQGQEAAIFRDAILDLCDLIVDEENEEECAFGGARVYDRMTRSQQLAALEKVSHYLFHPTQSCLELFAWSEATLATILQQIRLQVHLEIDAEPGDVVRSFLNQQLEAEVQPTEWSDHPHWDALMDGYESRFLWDMDFENETISDLPPEAAQQHRQTFGLSEEYFSAIPPDLDHDWDIRSAPKRIWMVIDGKKTIKMTVTLTIEIPASIPIVTDEEGMPTVKKCFPVISLMRDCGDGNAEEANDTHYDFFLYGSEVDHDIKELPNS